MQWSLSGAGAGEDAGAARARDPAEAIAEEESDGYVLDLRDGSELERDSDFEAASDERRPPVSGQADREGLGCSAGVPEELRGQAVARG